MRMTDKLVGLGMLALVAGCASMNPFASKPKGNQPAELVELKSSLAVRNAWTYAIGKGDPYLLSPALVDGQLYVAGADGALARLDAATGRQVWRIKTASNISAGVGADASTVVVGGVKGMLMAFDADGKALWNAQLSSEILSAPVIGQGMVVARSLDNHIVAFDAKTGEKKWTALRPVPALTLHNAPGMAISNGMVIIAQPGGKLLSLLLTTGAPRWEVAVGEARGATELERVTDIGGVPALFEQDVCTVSYQGRVGCFDVASGNARWTKELSSDVGVGVDQRFVFSADDKGAVSAFARDGGTSAWRNDKLAYRQLSTPISYGRTVAVGDLQGQIHFLSREDGAFLARVKTDGSPIKSVPLVAGTNLVFQTQAGTVTALAVE